MADIKHVLLADETGPQPTDFCIHLGQKLKGAGRKQIHLWVNYAFQDFLNATKADFPDMYTSLLLNKKFRSLTRMCSAPIPKPQPVTYDKHHLLLVILRNFTDHPHVKLYRCYHYHPLTSIFSNHDPPYPPSGQSF
jgi:hypothetical protein